MDRGNKTSGNNDATAGATETGNITTDPAASADKPSSGQPCLAVGIAAAGGREELRESEERFRNMFERHKAVMLLIEPESGTIMDANTAASIFYGHSREQLRRMKIQEINQLSPEVAAAERKREVEEQANYLVFPHRISTGEVRWVEIYSTPIEAQGKALLFSIIHDITERKRAEEALRESELFCRQTLESIPGMVFTTRPDGYCDYQNQQWVDFTGVPMIEHLGDGWNKLLHPDDRPRAFTAWCEAVEERAPYDLEYRVRRYDGAYEWFKVRGRPIRNEAGEIVRWFGTAVNIDQMLKAQEALRQKEERLRLAMAAARMASWDWNIPSDDVVWNDAHYRMMGYEPGEVQPSYDAWASRIHPEDRETVQNSIKQCMAEGRLYTAVFRTLWPDGTIRWLEARGDFEYDANNQPLRNYGVMLDITERKRAEKELRQAKEEWELTFNSVPDLIAIIDDRHRMVRVNRAMAEQIGRKPEECLGIPCYEAIHHSNLPPEFCPHSRTMDDGGVHNLELREERLGGDYLVTTTPLLDRGGRMTGTVHVARDITERKRAEVALKRAYEEMEKRVEERTAELRDKDQMLLLQSRQAAMGEMIGNIAHQWRQPLNFLGLTIQQLPLFYDLGKINRELLNQCVSSSMEVIQHMSRTIDDFRNYFRPDKEKVEFNVHDAIMNALSLLEGTLQNPRIDITMVATNDPVIYGYQNEFSQVLLNILMNARDALLERNVADPRVSITIGNEDGCTAVTIADNAGGIPEDIISKVFEPYFTTKGPQQGTGVGLFMSRTIIEKNMGGRLSVRNSADGAEFRIEVGHENTI